MEFDEEFNTLKHSLPFIYKCDKGRFFQTVEKLKELSFTGKCDDMRRLDLFYTFFSIGIRRSWFNYVNKIFNICNFSSQCELVKFVVFFVEEKDEINLLKDMFENLMNKTENDYEKMNICFLDSSFFKPLLHSSIKNMKMVNEEIFSFITELCLKRIDDEENKLRCLERIISTRRISEEEDKFLQKLLSHPVLGGRSLDILLQSGNEKSIKKSIEFLQKDKERYFNSDNNVHFFEVTNETIENINKYKPDKPFFEVINEIITLGKLIITSKIETDNLYHNISMIISSNYKYKNLEFVKLMEFCWNICSFEERKQLVSEILSLGDYICCYGLMINIFSFLTGIEKGTFLKMKEEFEKRDEAIRILKEKYPPSNELWQDPSIIEKKITEEIKKLY